METTKIPLAQCVESSYQNRKELGDVSGLVRSIEVNGQTKLRQWAHEAYEAAYECELDDAWEGFKEPRAKALDQFILMRTIPNFGQRDIRPGPLSHAPRSSAVGTIWRESF